MAECLGLFSSKIRQFFSFSLISSFSEKNTFEKILARLRSLIFKNRTKYRKSNWADVVFLHFLSF